MTTREELVNAIFELSRLNHVAEKDIMEQETAAVEARINVDMDVPPGMKFAETALHEMVVKMAEKASTDAVINSDLTDEELKQLYEWMSSPLGIKWQTMRKTNWDRTAAIRCEFHKLLGMHVSSMLFTKVLRMLVYTVHQLKPEMAFEDILAFCEKIINVNPFFSLHTNREGHEFARDRAKSALDLPNVSAANADEMLKQQCIAHGVLQCAAGMNEWPNVSEIVK
jgi:hypothetical protein